MSNSRPTTRALALSETPAKKTGVDAARLVYPASSEAGLQTCSQASAASARPALRALARLLGRQAARKEASGI